MKTPRGVTCIASVLVAGAGLLPGSAAPSAVDSAPAAASSTKFTPPPGPETADAKTLIDKARAALEAGKTVSEILADPAFLPVHEWPRFRQLIRNQAKAARVTITTPQEPGDALVVRGIVSDRDGQPHAGALVYVYQTSAKGWYADRAAHIAGVEGDRKHARLFGYLTTGADGTFELRTIRPGGYPESNLPAHIHVEVERSREGAGGLVTEIRFDDDPRLSPALRAASVREGFLICPVQRDAHKVSRVTVNLRVP